MPCKVLKSREVDNGGRLEAHSVLTQGPQVEMFA